MTEGEEMISKKLDALGDMIHSKDLSDLTPKTEREYLMIMYPAQKAILKHLEEINKFGKEISGRVRALEVTWKVGGAIILVSLVGLAAKMIFG